MHEILPGSPIDGNSAFETSPSIEVLRQAEVVGRAVPNFDLDALLVSAIPFDAWREEWAGVPLELRPYFADKFPPRDLIGSVRAITLCRRGVVIIDDPSGCPQLLAGGRPKGNETIKETLVREVAEETGWLVSLVGLIGYIHCRHLDEQRPDWGRPAPDWLDLMAVAHANSLDASRIGANEPSSRMVPWSEVPQLDLGTLQEAWLKRAVRLWV